MHYKQTQEHPGSKNNWVTRRGAVRAAAGTTRTDGIVAACARRPAGLPDAEIQRALPSTSLTELARPANAATAISSSLAQARLHASNGS